MESTGKGLSEPPSKKSTAHRVMKERERLELLTKWKGQAFNPESVTALAKAMEAIINMSFISEEIAR